MPGISHRGLDIPSSPIRKLSPLAIKAKERGINVFSLNIGQPDVPTPDSAFEALRSVDREVLEYSPSDGLAELRVSMSEYYKRNHIDIGPEAIIVTSGASEAVLFAFLSTLDPDDEVLIPEPAYANYVAFARIAGAHIIGVPSSIEDGFALPPVEEFERRITRNTRAILICNPNNPTGYVYTAEELEKLRLLAIRYNLFFFSDEAYREFCYTEKPVISVMQLKGLEENAVLIDSVSKRYNECGIRIGCVATRNRELYEALMKFCQARLSPPLLGQIVANASLATPESFLKEMAEEYRRRRDFMLSELNSIPGVYAPIPMGAFYAVASLPVDDAEHFCRWCLEEFSYNGNTIFMAPAAGFYITPGKGRNQVRLAYVLEIPRLKVAMETLRMALETYKNR